MIRRARTHKGIVDRLSSTGAGKDTKIHMLSDFFQASGISILILRNNSFGIGNKSQAKFLPLLYSFKAEAV